MKLYYILHDIAFMNSLAINKMEIMNDLINKLEQENIVDLVDFKVSLRIRMFLWKDLPKVKLNQIMSLKILLS